MKTGKEHRHIYIDNQPLEIALKTYKKALEDVGYFDFAFHQVVVSTDDSLHRVTIEPVYAKMSSPHYNGAAMDGIAVRAKDTLSASERTPIILKEETDFEYINTGNPLPVDFDSVIMIEDVDQLENYNISIIQPSYPWQHVRPVGEDIVKGEMIIPSKRRIRPMDLGALISAGVRDIKVYPKIKVGIIPTGSEITRETKGITKGQIIDSNSKMFEGLVIESGGVATISKPIHDEPDALRKAILEGIEENDLLIINAGSSAGSKDYTADLIRELGEVVIHGIAVKPGKPTILGIINNKCVIGIPGYPVSAYFAFEAFVKPILDMYCGMSKEVTNIEAYLTSRVVSSLKHEEYIRVTLGKVNNKIVATPLNRGAGNTMSLVKADGVLTVPINREGIESGSQVKVKLLKDYGSILSRLVFIGSHDIILDLIADKMEIGSGHVGSLGGIMAMIKGECHIAPIHLLDKTTGTYNDAYVKQYIKKEEMAIISGLKRQQGLMVQKGNPKNIQGFEDLIREDISYINRQGGSGTRILLDYELNKLNILPESVNGYKREMNTHMAVAATIQSKGADVGLGILAAANAMDLDFVPVTYEAYEFLVKKSMLDDYRIHQFIGILQSEEFQQRIKAIGGYESENPGDIRLVGGSHG